MKTKKTYLQKKIENIMKTSTGAHFLDSGGAYGRHWERNQKKGIDWSQGIILEKDWGCSIPIHQYMNTMFETDENTKKFNRVLSKEYYWTQEAIGVLSEKFEDIDTGTGWWSGGGNTYNDDNDLSQGFQYELFSYDGWSYVIFQLHQGCDIRGGYTNSVVFKVKDADYFFSWRCDFYDNSTDEQFDSYYDICEDERYEFDEEKHCFVNKETKEEVYPYSSAMGF